MFKFLDYMKRVILGFRGVLFMRICVWAGSKVFPVSVVYTVDGNLVSGFAFFSDENAHKEFCVSGAKEL